MTGPGGALAESTRDGVQALGLCRFSVPSEGGFQVDHDDIAARRAFLYTPARLDQRFAWFETVTLPALEAQKDPAFRLIVMLGEDFPEPWRSRMEAHIARVPQLVADYVPAGRHRTLCAQAIARHSDPEAEFIAQFRLDDDDAVAVDFTHRLRRDGRQIRGLIRRQGPVVLDYGTGFQLRVSAESWKPVPVSGHFWTAALAVFTRPGDGLGVLDNRFNHNGIWARATTVSLIDSFMFVRGLHGGNDSQTELFARKLKTPPEEALDLLKRRFRIDPVRVEALKSTLAAG